MQKLHDAGKNNGGFHVIAVSIDRFNFEKVNQYAKNLNLKFPVLLDPDQGNPKSLFHPRPAYQLPHRLRRKTPRFRFRSTKLGQPRLNRAYEVSELKMGAVFRRIKRRGPFWVLWFYSLFISIPDSAFSQPPDIVLEKPDLLLQKLDSHYYYPSLLGLKKLTATIKWLQKDLVVSPPKFISRPDVLFHWNVNSDARVFQAASQSKGLSESQKEEVKKFFLNYREIILPRSLNQTLSGFKFNGTTEFHSQTIAEYESPRDQDENQKYILNIDSVNWRVSKFYIERNSPPYKVTSHFKYIQKEGQWLVSESRARFEMGRDSYSETTSYTYRKILGFWLPAKIDQVLKKDRGVVQTYRFLLSDYQVN